jgi:hypothetical protein
MPLYPNEKGTINCGGRLVDPKTESGRCEEETNVLVLPRIEVQHLISPLAT